MPIIGAALESPFFEEFDVPAALGLNKFLAGAPARRDAIIASTLADLARVKLECLQAIWGETQVEEQNEPMSDTTKYNEVRARCGRFWHVTRRFALKRGAKRWFIDNHAENDVNKVSHHRRKIQMRIRVILAHGQGVSGGIRFLRRRGR
jgi:hypothetical protein